MPLTSLYKSILLVFVTGVGLSSDYRQAGDINPAPGDIHRIYPGEIITGADHAPVNLIVYINYECTYCAAFEREILPVLKTRFVDNGQLRVVHRIFPMSNDITSDNFMKSELALCSAPAGRFSNASDILFENQHKDFWLHYEQWADASGGDVADDIKACVAFHKARQAVIMTQRRYARHDVHVTPTIFIGGYKMEGLHPYEDYEKVIMRLLKS